MKNILNLIKINFISIFKGMFALNKKNQGLKFILMSLLLLGIIYFAFGTMMNSFAEILVELDAMNYLLFLSSIFSFVFVLFFITYEAQSYFFKTKDFELLSSLPIKKHEIVIAKYTSVLLSAYIYSSLIMIPSIIVYFMYVPFNFSLFMLYVLGFLFSPLVPMALGTVFGLIVSLITSKLKHSNIISIILFLLLFVAYFVIYFYMNFFVHNIVINGENLIKTMQYYLPSVAWFYTGFVQMNVLFIILDIILNVLITVIVIVLLTITYKKINQNLIKKKSAKTHSLTFNKKSTIRSYLKIEAKRFISYPTYVLNSTFSLLFTIFVPFLLKFAIFNGTNEEIFAESEALFIIIPTMLICINSMFAGISNTTSSSISIEGKQIQLLKSLPLKPSKIFFTKILFNNLIVIPFIFISNFIILILFYQYFNLISIIMLFVTPTLAVLAFSTYGLLINLLFPKFNFDNVNQVVKQSLSVFIVVISSIIFSILPMVCVFNVKNLNVNLFYFIFAGIYLILFVICLLILKFKANVLYNKLKI